MAGTTLERLDVASIMGALYGDGIVGLKHAFDRGWADRLHADVMVLFDEALQQPASRPRS